MGDFLISWRDFDTEGNAGTMMGSRPTYYDLAALKKVYTLGDAILNRELWLDALRPSGPNVVVFVHGFADTAEKVVERHRSIRQHLPSSHVALVSFDWPAGNLYGQDKQNAAASAPKLMSDCLNFLLTAKWLQPTSLHLFAHSMGAYVTETAFQDPQGIKIGHVVMAAADVDQMNYVSGSTTLKNFLGKCIDLTAYWSSDDAALQDSRKFNPYTPLGLIGFPYPDTPDSCWGVQCTTYYNRYVKYAGQPDTFSHIWYILYKPDAPAG